MKRVVFVLITVLLMLSGCADSGGGGAVQLDGPILEGINHDGELEFNGAIVNTGETAVKSVVVVIILKDEGDRIIEAISTLVPPMDSSDGVILPMESAFFTVSVSNVDPTKIFSRDVEIFYDEVVDEGRGNG